MLYLLFFVKFKRQYGNLKQQLEATQMQKESSQKELEV